MVAFSVSATNHYIRQLSTGTGNNSGVDWNNPITNWTGVSGQWVRGDTYFFAGGDYRSLNRWRLDAADSGSVVTTIKVSSIADHGTSTGWLDSFATNETASFYYVTPDTDNWVFDGLTGQWGTNIPNYIAYHAQVHWTNVVANDNIWLLNNGSGPVTNITLRHLEFFDDNVKGITNPPWQTTIAEISDRGRHSWCTNQYLFMHNLSSTPFQAGRDNSLNEYCVFARNGIGQVTMNFGTNDHSELVANGYPSTNVIWHGCIFQDGRSSAYYFCNSTCTNHYFIGCIFDYTGFWNVGVEVTDSTFLLDGNTSPNVSDFFYMVNCTFYNIPYGNIIGSTTGFAASNNCYRKNCLIVNCTRIDALPFDNGKRWSNIDHNSYFGSGSQSETGIENLSGVPFNLASSFDLTLKSDTAARDSSIDGSLPSGFLTDMNGNAFTTSRGAFQFVAPVSPWGIIIK